jgi:hypothetical protein
MVSPPAPTASRPLSLPPISVPPDVTISLPPGLSRLPEPIAEPDVLLPVICSRPPDETCAAKAMAEVVTTSPPPELTTVAIVVPPDVSYSVPPLATWYPVVLLPSAENNAPDE